MNAVGTNSISTSIPELWGHEFLAVRPNCEKWGTCRQTKTRRRDINKVLKLRKKKPPDFEKIYLKFSPLKFRSLYPFGKILVFRVQRCVSGNQWCHTIKKGRGERKPSTLAIYDLLQFKKVGVESSVKLVLLLTLAPLRAHYVTYVGLFYGCSFYDYCYANICE